MRDSGLNHFLKLSIARVYSLNLKTNKNGRGTEQHLPKTDETVRPAGERH